jgi:hypothetical protein
LSKAVAADAARVEEAFEQKASVLVASDAPESPSSDTSPAAAPASSEQGILAITKPRRYRNKEHLRYVARQACVICGRKPSDPHHLRYAQPRALGRKASDEFTVPLCRVHHREVHRIGNEQSCGRQPVSMRWT